MRERSFGKVRPVAVIGQGTWKFEHDDRAKAIAALRHGLDLGMSHVDTAEIYGSGAVEELVGEALAGRRDEVFLVSKVSPHHGSYEGVLRACENSLRRLGTDRLDGYLLHWPGAHSLPETIRAFEHLRHEKKILSWGLSNFDSHGLEEARAVAEKMGAAIACDQVLYHLDERSAEHTVLPWCKRHEVTVVAYSPFGAGHFPSERTPGGRALEEIAKGRGATVRQIALAFLLRDPDVVVIPKTSSVAHVTENAAAADIELTAEETKKIDEAFAMTSRRSSLATI